MRSHHYSLIILLLALLLSSCQAPNPLSSHWTGEKWKRISEKNLIRVVDLKPNEKNKDLFSSMKKSGYGRAGYAEFRGENLSFDEIRNFAASIGSDYVYKAAWAPEIQQRSQLVISSYTPASTVTSYASGQATANYNQNSSIYTPYGNANIKSQGTANAYGQASSNTYIPSSTTYTRDNYNVLVTNQLYIFWVSPSAILKDWKSIMKLAGVLDDEQTKITAAVYAQAYGLALPKQLTPKEPLARMSQEQINKVKIAMENRTLR
jgi:hypothetical protein